MSNVFKKIKDELESCNIKLLAVSKTHARDKIMELYNLGQRDFGENRVQEMTEKYEILPKDIRWHQIGHLQKNKVKYIAPWVSLIHSVDSKELLEIIDKEGAKIGRVIEVLLQIKIAKEETKFGMTEEEIFEMFESTSPASYKHLNFRGVMGMATFTDDNVQIKSEYEHLSGIYHRLKAQFFKDRDNFNILSGGMSGDYQIAIEAGCNMVRLGSILFGERS